MSLSTEEILHVAELARLRLSPENVAHYTQQAARILEYIAHLNTVDTTGVEPTAHAVEVEGFLREDTVVCDVAPADILANAPARDDDLFAVPKVL